MDKFNPRNVANKVKRELINVFKLESADFFEVLPTNNKGFYITYECQYRDIFTLNIYFTPQHLKVDSPVDSPLFVCIETKLRVVEDDKIIDCFRELRLCRISDLAQIPLILLFVQKAALIVLENSPHESPLYDKFSSVELGDDVVNIIRESDSVLSTYI